MSTTRDDALILINRYIQLLTMTRPELVAIKHPEGSFELSHGLWMLQKMLEPDYQPLTSYDAWITWVQGILYINNLIHIRHEIDISREILGRHKHEYPT